MANSKPPAIREESVEVDSETSESIFDAEFAETSAISSPPSNHSNIANKSLEIPKYESGRRSPILQDGLPGHDNWLNSTYANHESHPFTGTEPNYPELQPGHAKLSANWLQILQKGNRRYSLRDTTGKPFLGSGWQDFDQSGDYNDSDQGAEDSPKTHKTKIRKSARGKMPNCNAIDKSSKVERSIVISGSDKAGRELSPPLKRAAAKTRAQLHPSTKRKLQSPKRGKDPTKQRKSQGKTPAKSKRLKFDFDYEKKEPEPEPSDDYLGAIHMYIETSFCHPIKFNHVPPPCLSPSPYSHFASSDPRLSSYPCHFCTDPGVSYAIGGLGLRHVEVLQWLYDPTLGYEELDGGWKAAKEEETRMCCKCTLERVMICICSSHQIRLIKGLNPRTFDVEAALQGLVDSILDRGRPNSEKVEASPTNVTTIKWCSVCPSPAFFECCVRPAYTSSGIETSPSDDIGCGLLLCEVCADKMRGKRRQHEFPTSSLTPPQSGAMANAQIAEQPMKAIMTLDRHINIAARDTFHYHDGIRADACFLKADSELLRRQGMSSYEPAETSDEQEKEEEEVDTEDDVEYDETQHRAFKKSHWGMGSPIDLT